MDSIHKNVSYRALDISKLWGLNERTVEKLHYLLFLCGILKVKDGLDRTGKKNR